MEHGQETAGSGLLLLPPAGVRLPGDSSETRPRLRRSPSQTCPSWILRARGRAAVPVSSLFFLGGRGVRTGQIRPPAAATFLEESATMKWKQVGIMAVVTAALTWRGSAPAASHCDAPLIKQDPQANLTDVYAFISNKFNDPKTKVLNVVVQVHPFCEPGDGVVYDRFADDALYSIHVSITDTAAT